MIVVGAAASAARTGAAGTRCVAIPDAAIASGPRALLVPASD
jgi:hypothetical protein